MNADFMVKLIAICSIWLHCSHACTTWRLFGQHIETIHASDCGLDFEVSRKSYICIIPDPKLINTTRKLLLPEQSSNLTCELNNGFDECVGGCVSTRSNVSVTCSSLTKTYHCSFIYVSKNCDKRSWGSWSRFETCAGSVKKSISKRICYDCDGKNTSSYLCISGSDQKQRRCLASWGDWGKWSECRPDIDNADNINRLRKRKCFYINGNEYNGTDLCSTVDQSDIEEEKCNNTEKTKINIERVNDAMLAVNSADQTEQQEESEDEKTYESEITERTTVKIITKKSTENENNLLILLCVIIPIVMLLVALLIFVVILFTNKNLKQFSFLFKQDRAESNGRKVVSGPINGDIYAIVIKT